MVILTASGLPSSLKRVRCLAGRRLQCRLGVQGGGPLFEREESRVYCRNPCDSESVKGKLGLRKPGD